MKIYSIALLATALAFTASAAPAKTSENKPAKFKKTMPAKKNKKRPPAPESVNLSQFAPAAADATPAMQAALKLRSRKIVFDKPGIYKLRPVALTRPVQIILNDGVTIQALPQLPEAKGKNAPQLPGLFSGNRVKQIIFSGKGNVVIKGDKLPIFHFANSNNISISDIVLQDGSCAFEMNNCWGSRFINLAADNFKQGGNFHGGGWNNFINTQFRNISQRALTVVADNNGRIPNMTLDNCEFFNNSASIKLLEPAKFTIKQIDPKKNPKYRPPQITFRSCRFFNNSGTDLEIYGMLADGTVRIETSVFTTNNNIALKFNEFTQGDGLKAELVSCIFRPDNSNTQAPVAVSVVQDKPFGNIKFIKVTVNQEVHKKALDFNVKKPQGNLEGTLRIIAGDGSVRNEKITMENK